MTRAASLKQLDSLSPVQLCALRFIPLFNCSFAFLMIAQANGYLG